MVPTIFGILIVVLAALLWRKPLSAMLGFVVICTLFGGSSALDLPALGGSSIQPGNFALVLLVLRVLFSSYGTFARLAQAVQANVFLVGYCVYGAVTAFILPKIFAGKIYVPPMKMLASENLYVVTMLHFTPQNITSAVYLLGTLLAALAGYTVMRAQAQPGVLVRWALIVAWAHVGFGLADVALKSAGQYQLFDFIRNANYAQVNQQIGGVQRIAGTFPESSAYAQFGLMWLVLLTELWLRHIRSRATGIAALALAVMLLASTSSTAYVGIAGYGLLLTLRVLATPMHLPAPKFFKLFAAVYAAFTLSLIVVALDETLWRLMKNIVQAMTVEKMNSSSGAQRAFWARSAVEAFKFSYGLGIGVGSFRSSSLIAAIAGSLGVFGLVTFLGHLWAVLRPFALSTHEVRRPEREAIAAATAWAAVLGLIPAMISSPTPDPGLLFGFLSGFALALRPRAARKRALPALFSPRAAPLKRQVR